MSEKKVVSAEDLDWLRIRKNRALEYYDDETVMQKVIRKSKNNPIVPIGFIATTCVLLYGVYNTYHRRQWKSQYAMRARILLQVFTFCAVGYAMTTSNAASKIGEQLKKKEIDSTEMENELSPQNNSSS